MARANGYRFLEQDPIVDLCRYMIDMTNFKPSQIVAEANHGIVEQTVRNIIFGKTRRPTHNTIRCIIEGCGGQEVVLLPDGKRLRVNYEATTRRDCLKMANGHGWRGVEPIHPRHQPKKGRRKSKKHPAPAAA